MLTAAGVLPQTCEQRVGAPPHRHTKAGLTKVIADLNSTCRSSGSRAGDIAESAKASIRAGINRAALLLR